MYTVQCTHCKYISLLFSFCNYTGQKKCVNVVNNGNIRMPFKHYILNILSSDYCNVLKLYRKFKKCCNMCCNKVLHITRQVSPEFYLFRNF